MSESNAPKLIWLQDGNPDDPDSEPLPDYDGVTWCADHINDGDTKYIRFDEHERLLAAARAEVAATDPGSNFIATHEHADGGKYQILGYGKHREGERGEWTQAVFYRNEDYMLFSTDLLRWNARFAPLPSGPKEGA